MMEGQNLASVMLELKFKRAIQGRKNIFTKIIDDQKTDSRARAGGRISFWEALLRVGFLAPRDTERVFDACSGVELPLKQQQQNWEYSLKRWFWRK